MENVHIESTKDIALRLIKKDKWIVAGVCFVGFVFLFFIPQIGAAIVAAIIMYYFVKAHDEFMSNFARAHGMTYTEEGAIEDCNGRLFEIGENRGVKNVVAGTWNNFPIKIFNYSYTTGSGKSRSTPMFTVLEISFDQVEFPFIFLRSKKVWGLRLSYEINDVDVSLHGRRFKLSVAKGYEIEALQIFSEELLDYLTQNVPEFSIEFSKNKINIFKLGLVGSKKTLTSLLDTGKHIIDSSGPFISRLSDDFAALHPYYSDKNY
ncbi:MAG: hypothetical protein M3M85_04305 [bacterium]|nr:hypothetical protein [bacterium]